MQIPLLNLLYTILPLLVVGYFYSKWSGNKIEIIYATTRMVIQLLLVGYVLIYIFNDNNLYLGIFILSFMFFVSSWIALRNTQNKTISHFYKIIISIVISNIFHIILIINFILDFDHFYEPRYVIPIAGMIIANSMNVISLAIERFEKEFSKNEDFEEARKVSFKSAMIPQINSLFEGSSLI